jgi:sec-independent protein translocase protein TatB
MFDFQWSEIALIGVVALIAIGPKDMPVAIKAISTTIKKMRRMAGEFQGHVDDMLREADLGDVQSTIKDLRGISLRNTVARAVDPDRSMARAFEDPFVKNPVPPVLVKDPPVGAATGPAPAFIPPGASPPAPIQPFRAPAPSFVPPAAAHAEPPAEDI